MTVDLWTNRPMKSFFGATLHFINDNFEPKSRILGCQEFKGRHTSMNIATAFEEIVAKYEIQRKVKKVVSDDASSMICAFRTSLVQLRKEEEPQREETDIVDADQDVDLLLLHLPQRESCFAHTLQLCVLDGLKMTSPELKEVIKKMTSIVSSVKRLTVATEYLKK